MDFCVRWWSHFCPSVATFNDGFFFLPPLLLALSSRSAGEEFELRMFQWVHRKGDSQMWAAFPVHQMLVFKSLDQPGWLYSFSNRRDDYQCLAAERCTFLGFPRFSLSKIRLTTTQLSQRLFSEHSWAKILISLAAADDSEFSSLFLVELCFGWVSPQILSQKNKIRGEIIWGRLTLFDKSKN